MGYDLRCEIVKAAIKEIDTAKDVNTLGEYKQRVEYVLAYINDKLEKEQKQ